MIDIVKSLISIENTEQISSRGKSKVMMLLDGTIVSDAYFNGSYICVEGIGSGVYPRELKTMYSL